MAMERMRRMVWEISYTPLNFNMCRRRRVAAAKFSKTQLCVIPLLFLTSSFYKLILSIRHRLYHYHLLPVHRLPVPVISVGNLTWGGNGKTPMVEFISHCFALSGFSALILTRGYGSGDEAKMLQRHFDGTSTMIGVGSNRAATASRFLTKYGHIDPTFICSQTLFSANNLATPLISSKIGVAILDDGMQHLSLWRDMEIVMINGMMPWGNYWLLPLGPLREPLAALRRANVVVIHHADLVSQKEIKAIESTILEVNSSVPVYHTSMTPSYFFDVEDISCQLSLETICNRTVLCVSAIGSADSFVQSIEKVRPIYVERLDFSDHHFLQNEDIEKIRMRLQKLQVMFASKPIVIITEKDYDRHPELYRHLHPFEVIVLCSKLHILPHNGYSDATFKECMKQLMQKFYLTRS